MKYRTILNKAKLNKDQRTIVDELLAMAYQSGYENGLKLSKDQKDFFLIEAKLQKSENFIKTINTMSADYFLGV